MKTEIISRTLNAIYLKAGQPLPKLLFSTQFLDLRSYLGTELPRLFGASNPILAKIQLTLSEQIPPMSLHIGLLRIAMEHSGNSLVMDVIYDTTDSDRNMPVFAHILYDSALFNVLSNAPPDTVKELFGDQVVGF